MNSSGKWVLWLVLVAVAVALVAFAPKRPEVDQIVDPAPWRSGVPASANSVPGARVTSPVDASTGPSAATDAAPSAPAPPVPSPPVEVVRAPNAANMARVEVTFPSHAVLGTTFDIFASVPVEAAANMAEVVLQYDPSALQLMSMGGGEPGRAEATIQISEGGRERGVASFQFLVIARESKATVVTTAATAFDAAGREVKVIVPPPQEIALDRPPS